MLLGMEEIMCEVEREDMNEEGVLPPGFRFHPTDEELITFYLASKVFNGSFCGVQIAEVDLNRCEPWELPDVAKMGEREWYFFSLRDRKYPSGVRTNRATNAGYWKATGKDRQVYSNSSSSGGHGAVVGMKKTLVFYKGRAPRGEKTKWVMHEYRLDAHFSSRHTGKEEWVICRIFHKMGDKLQKSPLTIMLNQGQNYLIKTSSSSSSFIPNINNNSLPPPLEQPPPPPTLVLDSQISHSHHHQLLYPPIMQTLNQHQNDHQNPNIIHTQILESLINPPLIDGPFHFQPNCKDSSSNIHHLLSNHHQQDNFSTFKELMMSNAITAKQQCKKDPNFNFNNQPLFQLLSSDNIKWAAAAESRVNNIINQENNKFENPNFLFGLSSGHEMGLGSLIPSSATSSSSTVITAMATTTAVNHVISTDHPAFKCW